MPRFRKAARKIKSEDTIACVRKIRYDGVPSWAKFLFLLWTRMAMSFVGFENYVICKQHQSYPTGIWLWKFYEGGYVDFAPKASWGSLIPRTTIAKTPHHHDRRVTMELQLHTRVIKMQYWHRLSRSSCLFYISWYTLWAFVRAFHKF